MKLLITIQILRNILKIFKKRKGKRNAFKNNLIKISNNFTLRLRFNNHINLSSKCYKYLHKKNNLTLKCSIGVTFK